MEIIDTGIAVFKDIFLRSEEVIEMAEESPNWRQGTVGPDINAELRKTDMHDLDPSTELHKEILDTFIVAIDEYSLKYSGCRVKGREALRVGRYSKDGFYAPHVDSGGSERTISGVLYLNSDFEGGELHFLEQDLTIKPEEGMLVLFPSNFVYAHQSLPVKDGKKYICLSWFA